MITCLTTNGQEYLTCSFLFDENASELYVHVRFHTYDEDFQCLWKKLHNMPALRSVTLTTDWWGRRFVDALAGFLLQNPRISSITMKEHAVRCGDDEISHYELEDAELNKWFFRVLKTT